MGPERVPKQLNGIADTSDFYRLDYDDVVILGDRPYLIRNNEPEVRFGTVVIGRRGISKKEEFMFGSTSTKILHIAKDCSIWVIE